MLSGGSTVPLSVNVSKVLKGMGSSLHISLTDERPGPIGHADSNWSQLQNAGFAYQTHKYYEVLQNQSVEQEVASYDAWLGHMLATTDYKIGFCGIGSDGHTAGILPGDSLKFSLANAGFWDDGERQRISITPEAIARLDEVVVYLTGEAKRPLIDKLQTEQGSKDFPAQYLKNAGQLTVYNDWIGEPSAS